MSSRERWFFLGVVGLSALTLQPLWLPLATGMILAFLSEGPTYRLFERFQARHDQYRLLISAAFVLAVTSLFIAPLILLSWSAVHELLSFWKDLNGDASLMVTSQRVLDWLNHFITPWIERTGLHFDVNDVSGRLKSGVEPVLKRAAGQFAEILSGTPAAILFVIITLMAWVYFLVNGREQRRFLLPKLIPWPRERDIICGTMGEILKALVLTSVVLSVVQSTLVVLTLGLTGIPKFYLWGALAFFLSFIPVFGTAPVMIGAAIYSFVNNNTVTGIVILGMSVFIGTIDNFIRPMMMKGSTELKFFWLFMALVGGIAIFGLAGAVVGPWAFAMFTVIQSQEQKKEKRPFIK